MRSIMVLIAILSIGLAAPRAALAGPALLFDAGSGQVLYAEDPDNQWHPASLTKIMTAYLTFEALKAGQITLETKITCSATANLQAPSKLGLPVGGELTVDVALQALIVKSANDVAMMLAETVGGSQEGFVAMMNATAKRLGMDRTSFENPNGLPSPGQITTARDLAKLTRAIIADYPEHAHYWSMPEMKFGKQLLGTHNGLLKEFEGADGMKTGFICDSGYNVVASATRNGRRLMAIVLGAPTGYERKVKAAAMLEYGFQSYGWKQLFNPENIDTMPIEAGAKSVMTMRGEVVSWECGTGRKIRARKARAKGAKAKRGKASEIVPALALPAKSAEAQPASPPSTRTP